MNQEKRVIIVAGSGTVRRAVRAQNASSVLLDYLYSGGECLFAIGMLRQASVRVIYGRRELSLVLSGTLDSKAAAIRNHTS